ncbi:dihydropteroate synthase [Paenibacillus sp. PK4536]|uniref:dihydropteroate synthase n=1 Tax=Paenibacillus sp. PK4536 TaxID=3024576 RepID=UPI0023598977|nr:dihydropteroate synthase [Paenibacillus sp. PK4536]WIM41459.1 dihydropteroate synthase [Paenibacillus sp. PK4536]
MRYTRTYDLGSTNLTLGDTTLIMGILNVTPDSFSDGGQYTLIERAVEHALQMMKDGADLIDIGGESTRPGHDPVSTEQELERVIPIIEALHRQAPHIPLSIDTYKAEVAKQALQAGAHIINDVWGGQADPLMVQVAATAQCPIILMHNRDNMDYTDLVSDVLHDLQACIDHALQAGVQAEYIILDPGIGFAKTAQHNLQLMSQLDQLSSLGYPLLLGTSRKKFIRTVLDLTANDVVEGTTATTAFGIAQGCQIIRVHDIKQNKRMAMMCDAMLESTINQ